MNDKDIDTKFDVTDEVIKVIHDKLAHRCETIERRLAALEERFTASESREVHLRDRLAALDTDIESAKEDIDTQVGIWRNVNDRVQALEASINAIEDVLQDHGKMLVHLQTPKKADLETPVAAPQHIPVRVCHYDHCESHDIIAASGVQVGITFYDMPEASPELSMVFEQSAINTEMSCEQWQILRTLIDTVLKWMEADAAAQRTSDTVVFRQQPMYIKPLFEPGWSNDQKTSYEAGITDKREEHPDLTVAWYQNPEATLTIVQSWGDEAYFNLTAEKLRRLIGSAMEVLKRMEADNADAE